MGVMSNLRLLNYQARQRYGAPQAAAVPTPIDTNFAIGAPLAAATANAGLRLVQQQLAQVQLQARSLIDTYTPSPARARAPVGPGYGEPWSPGPGALPGADTSHWQSDATYTQSIAGTRWTALKATEGTTYTDPSFAARWAALGQKVQSGQMTLRMAYLFLVPGNGAAQAQHFLDVVGVHGPLPAGTRLALDWEGAALSSPSTLKQAADYIHQVTGLWPVIYVQGSKLATAQATVPQAPFWEAAWGSAPNRNVPFVQTSDGPGFDHDVFNGDQAALARFAGWR